MPIVFNNRKAIVLWGFAVLWSGGLLLLLGLLVDAGRFPGLSSLSGLLITSFFICGGVALWSFAMRHPCCRAEINADGHARLTWRYPHRCVRQQHGPGVLVAQLLETQDNDGDALFQVRLHLPIGSSPATMDIAEGPSREQCEVVCMEFNQAVRRHLPS